VAARAASAAAGAAGGRIPQPQSSPTAVALLHDEGRLDWTKPVRDYIPEFRLSDPVATDRATVRDLLCHQTGLPRHDWVHFAGDRSPAEMLGPMRHLELTRDIRAA
jgi:CubicO group peptidase (beta-lactamase class C family)